MATTKPRIVWFGKSPLEDTQGDLRKRLGIMTRHMEPTLIGVARDKMKTQRGVRLVAFPPLRPPLLGGIVFYTIGALAALGIAIRSRARVLVCQSPYEAVGIALLKTLVPRRIRPRLVVEVHGDWRTASRLYGSSFRRVLAPVADAAAVWALRRADRVRVIGSYTRELVIEAGYTRDIDEFLTFSDYTVFWEAPPAPLPSSPTALFVGVFERYKAVDVLLEAWEIVHQKLPHARLRLAGIGSMYDELRRKFSQREAADSLEFLGAVPRTEVKTLLDETTFLALPSRAEGLGRVVLEAAARGRAVVASRVGGIPEVVREGVTGYLVPPGDAVELASAMAAILSDPDKAQELGDAARSWALERDPIREYDAGMKRLAEWASEVA